MDAIEADDLYSWMLMEVKPSQMYIYRIANGEYTLRIKKYDFWCWNKDDFLAYRQAIEDRYSSKQLVGAA